MSLNSNEFHKWMRMEETVGIGYVTLKKSLIRDELISKGLLTKDKIKLLPPNNKKFQTMKIIRALYRDVGFYSLAFVDQGPEILILDRNNRGAVCVESSQTPRSSTSAFYDEKGRLTYVNVDAGVPIPRWGVLGSEDSDTPCVHIHLRQNNSLIYIREEKSSPKMNYLPGKGTDFWLDQKTRFVYRSFASNNEYDIQIKKSETEVQLKIVRPDGLIKIAKIPTSLERINIEGLRKGVVADFVNIVNCPFLNQFIDNGKNMMDEDYRLS